MALLIVYALERRPGSKLGYDLGDVVEVLEDGADPGAKVKECPEFAFVKAPGPAADYAHLREILFEYETHFETVPSPTPGASPELVAVIEEAGVAAKRKRRLRTFEGSATRLESARKFGKALEQTRAEIDTHTETKVRHSRKPRN